MQLFRATIVCDCCVLAPTRLAQDRCPGFIETIKTQLKGEPQNIQLWGGEPLVYIRTLKPLVAELKRLYPNAKFTMITNGSLLTRGINDWIMDNDIGVSMSAQSALVRNTVARTPLTIPRESGCDTGYVSPQEGCGRSDEPVGAMIHTQNPDRAAVAAWLRAKFEDPEINIGEGAVIEVYDERAKQNSPTTRREHLMLRETSFRNIRHRADRNFSISGLRMNRSARRHPAWTHVR